MVNSSIAHGPRLAPTAADAADAVQALLRAAAEFPTAGARTPAGLLTYPELLDRARRILTGLRERGAASGDAVILHGLAAEDFFGAFWACLLGGMRPAPISDPAAIGRLRHTWELLEEPLILTDRTSAVALDLSTLAVEDLAGLEPAEELHQPKPYDVAVLMLSSGSTGAPKAAALTHQALAEFAAGSRLLLDLQPGETMLNWLPLDHSGALLLYHVLPVFVGATGMHLPTADVLANPLLWLEKVAQYEVQHTWSPTFGLQLVADALTGSGPELSSVRSLLCGGEQVALPVVERFFAATAGSGLERSCFRPVWGMAETTTAITFGRLTDEGCVIRVLKSSLDGAVEIADPDVPEPDCSTFVAVGAPAPGSSVRVVGANDEVLPELRIGRLQVRSNRVTSGYANNPAATAAALPDGEWLRTGDLAFVADGQVVITGREGDTVVLNGNTVFCHEIEGVAAAAAGVNLHSVGACGVPNAATGTEDLVVFVEAGDKVIPAVKAAVFQQLRLPAEVVVVPAGEFPRTASGKVRRSELRERYLQGRYDARRPATAREVAAEVSRLVAELAGRPVAPEVPFYELGLTSVKLTRLRAMLAERFGIEVPATVPFEHPTAAALAGWITGAEPLAVQGAAADSGAEDRRVAIVGMAARFPGARTIGEFWTNLCGGVDSVSTAAGADGWVRAGGVLDDAESFDAAYFGLSPKEAALTEPAHRQFLEVAYEALEHGGYADSAGQRIGVYAGSGMNLYGHQDLLNSPAGDRPDDVPTAMQATIGTTLDFLASRVAYRLGLTGPAIGVQTACSTSLVAVHLAVQALLASDTDLALAGAAAVRLPQDAGYRYVPGSILSQSGRCRPFDADADGTVGGNGVAAVLLKRLDRALADGDTIHGVILGSAVNNDGTSKVGFTAPSVSGQAEVVRRALERAGVGADTISYVEAHGTGTALGDPVEVAALAQVFGSSSDRPVKCALGSVKANVGHLDSCAGMAGLIKTVLMLRHGQLVPTINLNRPNPELRIESSPFELVTSTRDWPAGAGPRRAGVTALGVGGTNAHVVLEEPPLAARPIDAAEAVVVPVSATSAAALEQLVGSLRDELVAAPSLAAADIATTLALGRRHHQHRVAVVGTDASSLATALSQVTVSEPSAPGPLAFAYSGQGASYPGMSVWLATRFEVARTVFDEVTQVLGEDVLGSERAELGQVSLFANQVAWTEVWRALGVVPDVVLGHSAGEYAALYAAGGLSLADGVRLLARRGELMCTRMQPGAMLAVAVDHAAGEKLAAECGLEVAAVNGRDRLVLSGAEELMPTATEILDRSGVAWRRMPVTLAFHSTLVDPVLDDLRAAAEQLTFQPLTTPFFSGLDGSLRTHVNSQYVVDHARRPVRFDLAATAAATHGATHFLELGPDTTLTPLGRRATPNSTWLPTQRQNSKTQFSETVATLYRTGTPLTWTALTTGHRIPLPGHPLTRTPIPHPTPPAPNPTTAPTPAGSAEPAPVGSAALPSVGSAAPALQGSAALGVPVGSAAPAPEGSATPAPQGSAALPPVGSAAPALEGSAVLGKLRELLAPVLGVQPEDIAPDVSFLSLGADSLSLMRLVGDLTDTFGATVPMRSLFGDVDTLTKLANHLTSATITTPPQPAAPPAGLGHRPPQPPPTSATVPRLTYPTDGRSGDQPQAHPVGRMVTKPIEPPPTATTAEPPQPPTANAPTNIQQIIDRQLDIAERMMDRLTTLMSEQLTALSSTPAPTATPAPVVPTQEVQRQPAPTQQAATTHQTSCDFSLYFFGDYPDSAAQDKYGLILSATEFADQHDFHSVWLPERHFHSFGALFPNPSVLAAALATRTTQIRLNAGSVVLPLHHPIRVAEEWSVVDNLSGGRIGLCIASGWHARDFVLAPDAYGNHRTEMYDRLDTVRRLWTGETITATAGNGEPTEIQLHPKPIQPEPPLFTAVVGNPESYKLAARNGLGVVTNLMAQSVEDLAANIALYRSTRAEHGLDPAAGRVVVLLHTYLGDDLETVRAAAYQPFCDYLRSSLSLFGQVTNSLGFQIDLEKTAPDDVDFLLGQAYQRYCESRALIGTPDTSRAIVDQLIAIGVNEVACFVDFGLNPDQVMHSLSAVDGLRAEYVDRAPATEEPVDEGRALTPPEQRIWFLEQLNPGANTYHEPKAIELRGLLDPAALQGALQRVVDRHPALRTEFRDIDGEPRAYVRPAAPIDCPLVDAEGNDIQSLLYDVRLGELDLGSAPLVRARLVRLAADHHVLLLVGHHIVWDAASTPVVVRDLGSYYQAWPADPGLPPAADGLREPQPADQSAAFWLAELDGAPELRFPTDRPRSQTWTGQGRSLTRTLDSSLSARVSSLAASEGITIFSVLLAGLGVVLSRFSGQRDFVIGTGVSGRDRAATDAVGMFVDTLPLRLRLPEGAGFAELARSLGLAMMDAVDHRDVPFEQIVAELNPERSGSRNPLFGVMVEFERGADEVSFAPDISVALLDLPSERAPMDLMLYLTAPATGIECVVEYDTNLFDETTIGRLLDYLELTLEGATEPVLSRPDEQLLPELEGEPGATPEYCLHQLFEHQVALNPQAIALSGDFGELTYAELDQRANDVAAALTEFGVSPGELVACCLPRGTEQIAVLLGVLKSGAGYLPLDPETPPDRLRFLLDDARPVARVTCAGMPDLGDGPTLRLEDLAPGGPVAAKVGPGDLAYVMYTSGSTGRPKGVLVPHRGPVNHIQAYVATHPATRTLQWVSPTFDVSMHEIFTTFAAGQTLVLIHDDSRYDAVQLAAKIRQYDVERIAMPFSAVHALLATRPELPSLREIYSAGEATTPGAAEHEFLSAHPECVLYNGYGPTESSIIVTEHRVGPGETQPPIGRPIQGVRVRVLDADRRPVPIGAVGEICVGGVCVTDGYLNRPAETAAAFFAPGWYATGDLGRWRADGTLEFHGRVDDQVQLRGVRIEPGEVRAAILDHPDVSAAAVVVLDGELVGYTVGAADHGKLTDHLAERLPRYLVPRRWVSLEQLPLTTTGKLDRSALPAPTTGRAKVAPATAAETAVHAVWCEVLERADVGVTDSFFELGGHSLLAVRLLNRLCEATDTDLTLSEFFRAPTIRALAAQAGPEVAPLTFAQRRALQRHRGRADGSIYNSLGRVDISGALDPELLRRALQELVQRHGALRTRVFEDRQEVLANVTVALPVEDLPDDEERIRDWCLATAKPALEPSEAPLWRVRLGRVSADRWVLVLAVHHIVFDGWSQGLFWSELSALYRGEELTGPAAQYADYARWEHETLTGTNRAKLEAFWRDELAGATVRPAIPLDHPRPAVLSGRGATHHVDLPDDLTEALRTTAATAGTTPYILIATAFAEWMGGLCGHEEVVLPVSSARRRHTDHEGIIGYIGEAVLVRVRLDADDLVAETARSVYSALDHEALPLAEVVRVALPHEAGLPYPAVLFTVITNPPASLTLPWGEFAVRAQPSADLARTELYVVFTLTETAFTLDIEYSTDLFTPATITSWAGALIQQLTDRC
ncbi:MupA/Atu3671 family FMN-dependent luciferase-like monooxygenase [Kribbella sp. NPDC056345]|uniref:MupA/Atu3671 family FMN-dependent luciferase-like monooxygenase n=1 Tax=Kribbella sp. NPDC056345 TaxID=3345789 RepID=UPI0035DAB187